MYRRQNYTVHFLVLRKKLVSYFASIKRSVTIIMKYITAYDNAIFVKVKKMTINFRNLFGTAIWLENAENGVLRLSDLKAFWGGMAPDSPSRLKVGRI